jgi:hypothetical protein
MRAVAMLNLSEALLQLGGWDAAEAELAQAADSDALADIEALSSMRAWLAALRGDDQTAETMLAALQDLRASEDPQDQAMVGIAEAFTAAARELLALLDSYQPGYLAPMLRAERDLARARLASDANNAEYLLRTGDVEAAAAAVEEAREIAARLRCQPLLDRAGALTPQDSPTLTPQDSPRVAS